MTATFSGQSQGSEGVQTHQKADSLSLSFVFISKKARHPGLWRRDCMAGDQGRDRAAAWHEYGMAMATGHCLRTLRRGSYLGPWPAVANPPTHSPTHLNEKKSSSGTNQIYERGPKLETDFLVQELFFGV